MKIRVSFTIDIDKVAWQNDYAAPVSVREDVQTYTETMVKEWLRDQGYLKD